MARAAAKALNFDVKVFMCVSYVTGCDLSLGPRNTAMAVPVADSWEGVIWQPKTRETVAALAKASCLNFGTLLTKTSHVMTPLIRGFGASVRSQDISGSSLKGTGLSLRPWLLAGGSHAQRRVRVCYALLMRAS